MAVKYGVGGSCKPKVMPNIGCLSNKPIMNYSNETHTIRILHLHSTSVLPFNIDVVLTLSTKSKIVSLSPFNSFELNNVFCPSYTINVVLILSGVTTF